MPLISHFPNHLSKKLSQYQIPTLCLFFLNWWKQTDSQAGRRNIIIFSYTDFRFRSSIKRKSLSPIDLFRRDLHFKIKIKSKITEPFTGSWRPSKNSRIVLWFLSPSLIPLSKKKNRRFILFFQLMSLYINSMSLVKLKKKLILISKWFLKHGMPWQYNQMIVTRGSYILWCWKLVNISLVIQSRLIVIFMAINLFYCFVVHFIYGKCFFTFFVLKTFILKEERLAEKFII